MSIALQFHNKYFLITDDLQTVIKECTSEEFNKVCQCVGEPTESSEVELPEGLVAELDKYTTT